MTAKRIVREVKQELCKENPDISWNNKEALKAWAKLCGSMAMERYILSFVIGEIQLEKRELVAQWQQTLCELISHMLRYGMPMEELKLPNFHEEMQQARNAEEALLAVLSACAKVTQKISNIQWPSLDAFGAWIARLQGQRTGFENVLVLKCLSFLNLQRCILSSRDLEGASLDGANLGDANLDGASLNNARLFDARLDHASLLYAKLDGAKLDSASLEGASLEGASLYHASLDCISWDDDTSWENVEGLETTINVPEALKQQLGLAGNPLSQP